VCLRDADKKLGERRTWVRSSIQEANASLQKSKSVAENGFFYNDEQTEMLRAMGSIRLLGAYLVPKTVKCHGVPVPGRFIGPI